MGKSQREKSDHFDAMKKYYFGCVKKWQQKIYFIITPTWFFCVRLTLVETSWYELGVEFKIVRSEI